jgi:hypothetical protein
MWLECVRCEDGQEEWKEKEKRLERHIEERVEGGRESRFGEEESGWLVMN